MKAKVVATAETVYQLQSLMAISKGVFVINPDGSFEFEQEFNNVEEAKTYLDDRAYQIAWDEKDYRRMTSDIAAYNQLTFDAVTARIESI